MSETDRGQILEVNNAFYRALGTRDIELMKGVWVRNETAGCVHPGWTILRSWESIIQSWESIFDPSDQVDINLSEISLSINKNIAWLTCIQEMIYINREPSMFNLSLSTNIFEKTGDGWLMQVHHASPLPVENYELKERKIQ